MERRLKANTLLFLLAVSLLPIGVHGASSGGVEASADTVSFVPNNPVMGGTVDISITLYNSQISNALGVDVYIYRDFITSDVSKRLGYSQLDVLANDIATFTVPWSGLTEGTQTVWFEWFANGDTTGARFSKTFEVQGLANLRIDTLNLGDVAPVFAGDTVDLSIKVANTGTVDAPESTLLVQVPGATDALLETPAIAAGASVWVNTTVIAPGSGTYSIDVTPDAADVVEEASEMNKKTSVEMVVSKRMDLSFLGELTVTSAEGALEGPWTVEGTLVRADGSGPVDVPLWLQIVNPSGGMITSLPFTVSFSGAGYSQQAFSVQLNSTTLSSLPDGDHVVTAKINPFNQAGLEQENNSNDMVSGILTKYPLPDVYVDAIALPKVPSVQGGEDVEWYVTMENTGDVAVSGHIQYSFDGLEDKSPLIRMDAGEAFTWSIILSTELFPHTATFEAQWVASLGSWDANKQNSFATGTVLVESDLKLEWELASLEVLDAEGNAASFPLHDGEVYTLSISVKSTNTGMANYTCQDSSNAIVDTMVVNIVNRGDRGSLACTFSATASTTNVRFIPEDPSISSAFSRSFATLATTTGNDGDSTASGIGTMSLFGLGALVLLGALVAAVLLTREREDEVERDIYEYCPSCDGELEGTEDRCPHCVFNLKKARSQFHDCHECGESIPDLIDNCAYCGAYQDVSSFFERRERRERREAPKEMVALPEDDDDQIVTGTQNFADAVKEFGFDEEHLEEEWDTNIVAAEAEVEAAYDRRYADQMAMEEMTEDEIEAYKSQVTTTLRTTRDASSDHDLDAFLSEKGQLKSLAEDTGVLSASDADIRERLFEITGEDGVRPGEKVKVGMNLTDSSLAGNEVSEAKANFRFDDDQAPLSASMKSDAELKEEAEKKKPARRRPARDAAESESESETTDECGACGADLPADATECGTCGARFG
jgi:ribosomal protein L40E